MELLKADLEEEEVELRATANLEETAEEELRATADLEETADDEVRWTWS